LHNQCQFIGHLGADVETRSFQNGGRVANFRIAITERWKDKNGEKKEHTEWVPITIYTDGLVSIAEKYLRKGSKVFVSGKWKTRKWQDQQGNDRYSTELVLQGFDAKLVMLDGVQGSDQRGERKRGYDDGDDFHEHGNRNQRSGRNRQFDELDDEVPF